MKRNETDNMFVDVANPEFEVVARAHRRMFIVSCKLRILQESDNAGSVDLVKF